MAFKIVQRYGGLWTDTDALDASHNQFEEFDSASTAAHRISSEKTFTIIGVCRVGEFIPSVVFISGMPYQSTNLPVEDYWKDKYTELVTGTFTDAYGVYIGYFEPEQWDWEDSMELWKRELIELGENVMDIVHWWEEEHDLLGEDEEDDEDE